MIHDGPPPSKYIIDLSAWGFPEVGDIEIEVQRNHLCEAVYCRDTEYNKPRFPGDIPQLYSNHVEDERLSDQVMMDVGIEVLKAYYAGVRKGREDKLNEIQRMLGIKKVA